MFTRASADRAFEQVSLVGYSLCRRHIASEREINDVTVKDNQLSFKITFEREGNSFTSSASGDGVQGDTARQLN